MLTQGPYLEIAALTPGSERPVRARLSAVVGEIGAKLSGEGPEGTTMQIGCPECGTSLESTERCSLCGAPLARLNLRGGGTYQLCSRRGCGGQTISGPCTSEGLVPLAGRTSDSSQEGS